MYSFKNWTETQFTNNYFSYLFLQISNIKPQLCTPKTNSPCRQDIRILTTVSQLTKAHRDISAAPAQVPHALESQWISHLGAAQGWALPSFHTAAVWCGSRNLRARQIQVPRVPGGTSSPWRIHMVRAKQGQYLWAEVVSTSEWDECPPAHAEDTFMNKEKCSSWIISLRSCHLLEWSR